MREDDPVFGPKILVRSLSEPGKPDERGNRWQYHSRSDRHSKIACWGILFDLMQNCPQLLTHIEQGRVVFGINHEMRDFKQNRKKKLDLVLCTPGNAPTSASKLPLSFRGLVEKWGIRLSPAERKALLSLPDVPAAPVGAVLVALEAKACMTAHLKALPRLYDELNSSHLTIHGSTDAAIAAGFVMVNVADAFISPDENKVALDTHAPKVSSHRQPECAQRAIDKVREIPRRAKTGEEGFDAVGIVAVSCRNDGSAIELVTARPAPTASDIDSYDMMIRRIALLYGTRFLHV
ncbi:hypothetical protein [Polyangium sp. y55x31]|uniref:hypothetical protein n=1 Tax=Polyangium sp. y55x31 TaxID=3042688 RepID=UPI002482AC9F|nr:hypothetical protein [Polyangium sp. y55x31]MDI1484346.1 hypothetical protein [Polyangium sp. y55x31]